VIVSHGGPLRILLCNLLRMPIQRQWQLRLDHGSLSAIDLLPVYGSSMPQAILALLNMQRPTYADHSAKSPISAATSEHWQEKGTL
jgi:broad specificity phosphatase PhoE